MYMQVTKQVQCTLSLATRLTGSTTNHKNVQKGTIELCREFFIDLCNEISVVKALDYRPSGHRLEPYLA